MITFKKFMQEAAMRTSTYNAVMQRLADSAEIGFEIELLCPKNCHHWISHKEAGNTQNIGAYNTMRQFDDMFEISTRQKKDIDYDYGAWLAEHEDEYVQANWRDSGDDEREARAKAIRAFPKKDYSWVIWFGKTFTASSFVQHYKLEPKYGWSIPDFEVRTGTGEYMHGWEQAAIRLADDLKKLIQADVKVNHKGYAYWNITHDTSILDNAGVDYKGTNRTGHTSESGMDGYGFEIVSPPLPPADAIKALEQILKFADQNGFQTNESTGLHVNLSLQDMSKVDPLKLVLFIGDKHVLTKFNRLTNAFTKSQLQAVIDGISLYGTIPKSADEIIKYGQEALQQTAKNYSVNLQHLPKYIEFRSIGGTNYHMRLSEIKEVIGRWMTALEIAANPKAERTEYLKKIMQLLKYSPG